MDEVRWASENRADVTLLVIIQRIASNDIQLLDIRSDGAVNGTGLEQSDEGRQIPTSLGLLLDKLAEQVNTAGVKPRTGDERECGERMIIISTLVDKGFLYRPRGMCHLRAVRGLV